MTILSAEQYLSNYIQKTKPLFQAYLQKKIQEAEKIGDLPAEVLERFAAIAKRGKKVRGALVVLGYQLAGGKDLESIYNASLFIELFHAAVLVHDDIMDQDVMRRGLPTLNTRLGIPLAICAGDMAFYLSWEKLLTSNFPTYNLVKAGRLYSQYVIRLAHGQILDVKNVLFKRPSEKSILNIFRYKTAEYTGVLPLLIGATLGGMEDKKKLNLLKEYGISLGWAFQIQDDILGLYGDEKLLGKPIGSDLRERKITLFVWYVMKYGSSEDRKYLQRILGNKHITKEEIIQARKTFIKAGAYKYVVQLGWNYVDKAKKLIPIITKDRSLQKILESFLTLMMERIS